MISSRSLQPSIAMSLTSMPTSNDPSNTTNASNDAAHDRITGVAAVSCSLHDLVLQGLPVADIEKGERCGSAYCMQSCTAYL